MAPVPKNAPIQTKRVQQAVPSQPQAPHQQEQQQKMENASHRLNARSINTAIRLVAVSIVLIANTSWTTSLVLVHHVEEPHHHHLS